jgi:hypothetical protein
MYSMRSGVHLQYNNECCYLYTLYCLLGRDKEKCYLYSNGEHGLYSLCSGIHLQYNDQCRHLYNLCCCLYRRNNLSVYFLYRNDKQGLFSVFVMSRWKTEKCYLYSNSKYCVYLLCSGVHVQYHYKCCYMYCL